MNIEKKQHIILKAGKEKLLSNYHPWIFSGAIKTKPGLADGTLINLCLPNGEIKAMGHYFNSSLAIRVITFNPKDIIDDDFWLNRLLKAKNLRDALNLPNQHTNAFRLIHGESDGFSGLVCDIFNDTASLEISNIGLLNILPIIKKFLIDNYNIKDISVNQDNKIECAFLENNLSIISQIGSGQKTGYFLDQRANRLLLRNYAQDRNILDTFCYSGGFSLNALNAGAKKVVSVDISHDAILLCNKNTKLNNLTDNHTALEQDVFLYLRTLKKDEFDLIILDPPAFAKTKNNIEKASRGYKDINLLAIKNIKPNGIIFTFSCSQHISYDLFKKIIFAAAKDANRKVSIIHELTQSPDHPTSIFCPQTSYLKGLVLWVG